MTTSYVTCRHGISPSLIFGWGRRINESIRADGEVVAKVEVQARQRRIRELERVLGKKTLENEILPPV